jgi:ectoine hydroxylase-related dioxygenase (phytanoyl-CoA dioxygenase family)
MTDAIRTYGVRERDSAGDPIGAHAERIRLAGYSVLKTDVSSADIADIAERLDAVLDRQTRESGDSNLAAIGDALTARSPLVYDEAFLSLATYAPLLALCRQLLGDFVVLMQQNGVINPSGGSHSQAAYHRDLPYQHFVSSRPLAISALFCIDPFRVETGATIVIPGSHRVERFPSDEAATSLGVSVGADAGSFVVFDSMLFHRAGANTSGARRRAVNHVFSVPIIAQQISLPAALGGRYAADPQLARLLGYESAPAASVQEWRERRLRRLTAPGSPE